MESNRRDGVLFASSRTADERAETANVCVVRLAIRIPALIDEIDNPTERAYTGWPDRLYIVGTGGRIQYKSAPGPHGCSTTQPEEALGRELSRVALSERGSASGPARAGGAPRECEQ